MFGQVVLGPPGAGKTTYCCAMEALLRCLGRDVYTINLDPAANHSTEFKFAADMKDLINTADIMDELSLGPNGALLYCMEFLEANMTWLFDCIDDIAKSAKHPYFLFDLPGQVELYMHHGAIKSILKQLEAKRGFRLVCVHLTDSYYCTDPAKYIAVLMNSLVAMIQLEMPQINILSKIDLLESFGPVPFGLDYFTEVLDLQYTVDRLEDNPFLRSHRKLSSAIAGVVEDYSLVSFLPLNVQDRETLVAVCREADRANGYYLAGLEVTAASKLHQCAMKDVRTEAIEKAADKYVL